MFEWMSDPNAWLALTTLIVLEIILGIDNIIFLSLVVAKLPKGQQGIARRVGLGGAMFMRIALLASLAWVVKMQNPLFYIYEYQLSLSSPEELLALGQSLPLILDVSMRDIVLFLGGLFLVWKGSLEIKAMFLHEDHEVHLGRMTFSKAITQIIILDIVFSLDSVITAVGLSDQLFIMVTAVVVAVIMMMFAAKPIGDFVEKHPTIKTLALAFLVLVGIVLIIDSFHIHVPKAYIYFAIAFSLTVEMINLLRAKKLKKAKNRHD